MDKKAWIIFSVIVVVMLGGLIWFSQKNKLDVSGVDPNKIVVDTGAVDDKSLQPTQQTIANTTNNGGIEDHVFGKKDSKVVLIEYGDYQCPGCGSIYPTLQSLSEKYKDQLAFVFRNFPLSNIHPNARAAAAAAEAAGLMGKYWPMHDLLYENQDEWSNLSSNERTDQFTAYAKEIGLDPAAFKTNLEKASINQKISFDQAIGKKADVSATPTLILNGEKLGEAAVQSPEELEKAIKEALKKNGIALPKEDAAADK